MFDVVVDKNNPTTLFAATGIGVFRSADEGQTWQNLTTSIAIYVYSKELVLYGNKVFATTMDYGLLKSEDYGETWETLTNGLPNNELRNVAIADPLI